MNVRCLLLATCLLILTVGLLTLSVAAAYATDAQALPRYRMKDLGLGGGQAYAINNSGQIAGDCWGGNGRMVFLYDPRSGARDLGAPDGSSWAYGINNAGQVVGGYGSGDPTAFEYTAGIGIVALPGVQGWGLGINDAGVVVGKRSNGKAFMYTPGSGVTDLGALGCQSSLAYRVNEAGQAVGTCYSGIGILAQDLSCKAFVYASGSGMTDLSLIIGAPCNAFSINDAGQVAGAFYASDGNTHAYIYTPGSGVNDLGTLGGDSYAYGINNNGQVVGFYCPTHSRDSRAFSYTQATGMIDLGVSGAAEDVNDFGQIVGWSSGTGPVLWTPIPEPSSLLALAGGIAMLGGFVLRRREP